MSDTEFLDVGDERRPGLSWRVRLLLLTGLATLVVAGLLVDRELRQREQRAVATCAARANTEVDMAGRRVRAAYEYVRSALIDPTPELQAAVRRVIEKSAQGVGDRLSDPLATCADVTVFPLHDELQARRDRCVDVLEAHRSGLAAVAEDGGELGDWLETPRTC